MDIETYRKLFKSNEKKLEEEYYEFLRFASISADKSYLKDLQACAGWLESFLKSSGFDVTFWNKDTYPVLFAQNLERGPEYPTLLIYNHYDVQPVDPIDLWQSPPFTPTRLGSQIVARGAQDNKGQCFYVMSSLRALFQEYGKLPLNIKLLIEGEEESGSKSLPNIIQEKKQELKADYLLVVDVGQRRPDQPAITLGTRGLVCFTVDVASSFGDLHSGVHGGMVYNPLHALVEILASLRDASGHIAIPGFYEAVQVPSTKEHELISFDLDEEAFRTEFGCLPTGGERGFSPLERAWLRPTLEINGITGGYGGPGTKTVIPAKATAKLSCRLVSNQDPLIIAQLVKRYIESKALPGFTVQCHVLEGMGKPVRTKADSHIVKSLAQSCQKVYQKPVEYIYEGASIPIISELAESIKAEVAFFGLGLAQDKIHAPNENFGWDRMENGFIIMCDAVTTLAHNHKLG